MDINKESLRYGTTHLDKVANGVTKTILEIEVESLRVELDELKRVLNNHITDNRHGLEITIDKLGELYGLSQKRL